jgi:flagellin
LPLIINSQQRAIALQRESRKIDNALATSLGRIASGLRIRSAADDVAGLSISSRMEAQVKSLKQSINNMSQGNSLLQTMDGSLGEVSTTLQRMRELSLTAINEYIQPQDRDALDAEYQALKQQIDAVALQSSFQNKHLFDGSVQNIRLQVGSGPEDEFYLSTPDIRTVSLGRQARYQSQRRGIFLGNVDMGQLTLNGVRIRQTTATDDRLSTKYNDGSAIAKAQAINDMSRFSGVRAIVGPTVIRGEDSINQIDLSQGEYIRINGVQVSGFMVYERDATGQLVDEINRNYELTGVVASIDQEGQLVLEAKDGRNIDVEYSNVAVRQAFRIIDAYGDILNLANTVELSAPDRLLHGTVVPTVQSILAAGSTFGGGVSAQGQYLLPKDNIDYVIEVVTPGPFGVATYRYKEETVSEVEPPAENYSFLQGSINAATVGAVQPGSTYLAMGGNVTSAGTYSEGQDRLFTITVTSDGTTNGTTRAKYQVSTDVDGVIATNQTITANTNLNLGFGVQTRFNSVATNRNLSVLTIDPDQKYTATPSVVGTYTGDFSSVYTVNVVQDGYTNGTARIQIIKDGVPLGGSVAVNGGANIPLSDGLSVNFPAQNGLLSGVSALGSNTGSYNSAVTTTGTFTGATNKTLAVRVVNGGVVGGGATYEVLENGVVISGPLALNPNSNLPLADGAFMRFANPVPTVSALGPIITPGGYNGTATFSGTYTGPKTGIFDVFARVKQAGRINDSAVLEYSLDGGVTYTGNIPITSGGPINLQDGLRVNFSAGSNPTVSAVTENTANFMGNLSISGSYSGEFDQNVLFNVVNTGALDGTAEVVYSLDGGATFSGPIAVTDGNAIALGNGLSATFNIGAITDELTVGDTFSFNVEAFNMTAGDIYRARVRPAQVASGDTFQVTATSRMLAAGSSYQISANAATLKVGDTFQILAKHSFDNATPLVLTPTVNLPNGVQVDFGGGGSFAIGDEFRIHTRGYTGNPIASGIYTDTLHPTTYKVTVTQAGNVGTAKFRYDRADGLGSGTNLTSSTSPVLLSEGVEVSFTPGFLSVGDEFYISAGEKLNYTFGGSLTLQSEGNIEVEYDSADTNNQYGRLLYNGDPTQVNEANVPGDLQAGLLGASNTRALDITHLGSRLDAEEAVDNIDLSLSQISKERSDIGAAMNRLEQRINQISGYIEALQGTQEKIRDADFATEVTQQVANVIRQNALPQIMQVIKFQNTLTLTLLKSNQKP